MGIVPLGTGNDLARCLRWGGGYEGESVHKLLHKIARASSVLLDRWLIELSDTSLPEPGQNIADTRIPYNIINNYFSVGVVSFPNYPKHVINIDYRSCSFRRMLQYA